MKIDILGKKEDLRQMQQVFELVQWVANRRIRDRKKITSLFCDPPSTRSLPKYVEVVSLRALSNGNKN